MNIQRLTLENFRNIHTCELFPGQAMNVLFGENGQGKTNIIESIFFLSNLSSFRSHSQHPLVFSGETHARIQADVACAGTHKELSVFLSKRGKAVRVNGNTVARGVDYFGELAAILFSPETLDLVQGRPEYRRRLLDIGISRLDRRYLLDLREYRRILEQRNRLLRLGRQERAMQETLKVWTDTLIQTGSRITHRRVRYLARLAPICAEIFIALFHGSGQLGIRYDSSVLGNLPLPDASLDFSAISDRFSQKLQERKSREFHHGATMIGPHLDDLTFLVADRPAKAFCSQGELRLLALSVTLAEARFFQEQTGHFPILLLDDVNSELDGRHQQALREYLLHLGQVFLTTTDRRIFEKTPGSSELFRVRNGEIILV